MPRCRHQQLGSLHLQNNHKVFTQKTIPTQLEQHISTMIPRLSNSTMKLSRHLSLLSPPLKVPQASYLRYANRRFEHTSISTIARRCCTSHFSILLQGSPPITIKRQPHIRLASSSSAPSSPSSTTTSTADSLIETLTDLYNTARDEFEIAAEETEKKSTYGPEDREAAHAAFDELKTAYDEAIVSGGGENAVGKEVERRIGSRIRELEHALKNMDEMALED